MAKKVKDLEIFPRYKNMANWGLRLGIPGTLLVISMLLFICYTSEPSFIFDDNKILNTISEHFLEITLFSLTIGFTLSGLGILFGNRARKLMPPEFAPVRAWLAIIIGGLGITFLVIILWIIKTAFKETIRMRPERELADNVFSYFRH